MTRIVHYFEQGSDSWHAHRATPGIINASWLAAMMGIDKKTSYSELLRMVAGGEEKQFSSYVQEKVINKGHTAEKLGRTIAETIVCEDLPPAVMSDTIDGVHLSASLDGITDCEKITLEHKLLSQYLEAALATGFIPEEHHPQCEAGLMVSGAEKCMFMASKDGDATTAKHVWYYPNHDLRKKIIAVCKQFAIDRDNYVHVEAIPAAVAAPQMSLPSVSIQVQGSIALIDNLDVFGEALTAYVERINKKPETDQDFADLESTVKTLRTAEDALNAAENGALGQAASIDSMRRTVALYRAMARDNRLMVGKLVEVEKQNRRADIIRQAQDAMVKHIDHLNKRVNGLMPRTIYPFADAIKGLKSIDSMREKVGNASRDAMFEANDMADRIGANMASLITGGQDWTFLFPDLAAVCTKADDDFAGLLAIRISQHRAAEAKRVAEMIERDMQAKVDESSRAYLEVTAQAKNDQRGKADAGINEPAFERITAALDVGFAPVEIPAGNAASVASTPPDLDSIIDDFLDCVDLRPAEKRDLRVYLVKWEKYRLAAEMREAA